MTVVVLAACAASLVLGWISGERCPTAYVTLWALSGLAVGTAWNLRTRFGPSLGLADTVIRTSVLATAVVVFCGLVLGALRRLSWAGFLVAEALLFAGSLLVRRRALGVGVPARFVGGGLAVGVTGALVAVGVAFAVAHAPYTLYDSLSYHLFFPARWLQEHALSIIPTPFSDEAQAYAPANGELVFLWLMLPFHSDVFARFGQVPFGVLSVITLYALSRRLGAPPEHALYPPAFLFLARPVLEQFVGADVDLICATFFLTSLWLGLVAIDRDQITDWALWGVSVGLFAGSKYLALVYLPVLVILALARGFRPRAVASFVGIALFALPWYLRNWVVAGSPIYPQTLSLAGITLAQGAFTRAAMTNSVFHTNSVALLPVMAARAFGPTLFAVWPVAFLVGAWRMMRGRDWWPQGVFVLVPVAMVPLYWFGFPVNTDPRFFMPAIAPALLTVAFLFGRSPRWNLGVQVLLLAAMVWILVGVQAEIHAAVPWFMSDWLTFNGLIATSAVGIVAVAAFAVGALWRWGPTRMATAMACTIGLVLALTTALSACSLRGCAPEMLDVTSPHVRNEDQDAWAWLREHVTNATVAYTGINLPYPLTGVRLTNRVIYVNIDGRDSWRLHDYDRAYREGRLTPKPPFLATSSGELRPVDPRVVGPRNDASRPRYERLAGNQDAWLFGLERQHVTLLSVHALSAYEVDYQWHNSDGFPIEDEWAKSDPQTFHLVYENPLVRMYQVTLPRKDRG